MAKADSEDIGFTMGSSGTAVPAAAVKRLHRKVFERLDSIYSGTDSVSEARIRVDAANIIDQLVGGKDHMQLDYEDVIRQTLIEVLKLWELPPNGPWDE